MDLLVEFLDIVEFDGVTEDGTDGAQPDFRVWIFEKVAQVKDGLKSEALEVAFGEFGGLALEFGELGAEFRVLQPAVQGAAAHSGEAGGLGDGWGGGEYGKSRLLARGEVRFFCFRAILGHIGPWASVAV